MRGCYIILLTLNSTSNNFPSLLIISVFPFRWAFAGPLYIGWGFAGKFLLTATTSSPSFNPASSAGDPLATSPTTIFPFNEVEFHSAIRIIKRFVVVFVRHNVNLRLGIVERYIEPPHNIVAQQSAHLGMEVTLNSSSKINTGTDLTWNR